MKKNIIYTLLVAMAVLLSACGSNSKDDPIKPTPPPVTNGYAFNNLTSELNITSYEKYKIEFQLTKDGIVVPATQVNMKAFDQHLGSVAAYAAITDENGNGNFIYTPPTVFPEAGTLTIEYTDGNITLEAPIALDFNLDTDASDGRATTLSIAYETTECDEFRGIVGHYHVHAVDRKSNVPLVGIPVKFSLVNGVVEIHNDKVQKAKGDIYDTDPVTFMDNSINFLTQTKVQSGDNLIIFPSEDKTDASYLGGWDIKSVGEDLTFSEHYLNLEDTTNLTYIIGNEERLLGGENGNAGTLANAHIEAIESITDAQGYAYFDIVFDAILAGHTVTVEAHGNEDGNRIGISQKVALRLDGDSFTAPDGTIVPNSGNLEKASIPLQINPSCTGTQPLIDVPINPSSFHVTEPTHCQIDTGKSNYHTDGYGRVTIAVDTDGIGSDDLDDNNVSGVDECIITWDGDISSLIYEY